MKQYFIEKSNKILSIYTKIKAINNIYIRKNQQQKNVLWILKKLLSTPAGVVGSATSDISTHRNHTAATCGDFCTGIWHPTTIHPFFQPPCQRTTPPGFLSSRGPYRWFLCVYADSYVSMQIGSCQWQISNRIVNFL